LEVPMQDSAATIEPSFVGESSTPYIYYVIL
jgi:hypothetical protein